MIDPENMIVVPENILRDMCIPEDDLTRENGICPESKATMVVCVDGFENGLVSGRVCSCYMDEPRIFRSLDQMLFVLDDLLDLAGWPMRNTQLRGKSPCPSLKKESSPGKSLSRMLEAVRNIPDTSRLTLRISKGKKASFYIRVYSRQYTSMQGIIAWLEKGMEPEAFRSGMELISLVYATLNEFDH